jgi:hypothetical protein
LSSVLRSIIVWVVVVTALLASVGSRAQDGGAIAARDGAAGQELDRDAGASRDGAVGPTTGDSGRARREAGPQPDGAALPDWVPKIKASVKPAIATLGDPILVTIRITHRKGVSVSIPLKLELGKFTEIGRDEQHLDRGEQGQVPDVERTFSLRVAAYELGELELPPIEVTALGPAGELLSLKTLAVPIQIRSVLGNEPDPKVKDLEPPVEVFQRDWLLLYILIALAALAVIVTTTLLVNRALRARKAAFRPPVPKTPPHQIALDLLASLNVADYVSKGQFKELYLRLSEILRGYVGGRWDFDALEMTTREINDHLADRRVDRELRQRLDRFFVDCDLVKFAKYRPCEADAFAAAVEAKAIVLDTAPTTAPIEIQGAMAATPSEGGRDGTTS